MPSEVPQREETIAISFAVVAFSVFVQGLTWCRFFAGWERFRTKGVWSFAQASGTRRPGKTGGYAAFASHVSCIAGYQCDSVERHSSFKRGSALAVKDAVGPRICCFFTMRLLTT